MTKDLSDAINLWIWESSFGSVDSLSWVGSSGLQTLNSVSAVETLSRKITDSIKKKKKGNIY